MPVIILEIILGFQGVIELGLIDNYDLFDYTAPSNLPRVRTNIKEYLKTSRLRLNNLQILNIESAGNDFFYMGYLGYLESMYGGVGGEMLYRHSVSVGAWGWI